MTAPTEAGITAHLGTRWLGQTLEVVPECASSNDEIKARAQRGAAHGLVVIARAQHGGRGRRGHAWYSPPGQTMSVVIVVSLLLL